MQGEKRKAHASMHPMDNALLDILACPFCKGELFYDRKAQELICQFDRSAWPIVNGIPVMLESHARKLEEED